MSLKQYLEKFDEEFMVAEAVELPRGRVDEGEYHVEVTSFQPKRSQSGKDMFHMELEIIEGKFKGRKLSKYLLFHDAASLGRTKLDLIRCGLRLERFSDIADRLGEMFAKRLIVSVKHQANDEKRVNVYIESELKPEMIKPPEPDKEKEVILPF
ncbi:DUF669 domain-containing protein [Thermoactinomyces sp. DSM 45892]|uniref:DUF669 domain-containing protein n=1 Tax=Thermoactinomyces sp. DSM 45892 TaxID=1882753 RepID=UPI00089CF269|nr:DUF669 domain-containing protein [Thermoactinomyces sp. DSM 45892]SDY68857.1 Protein of unknown function [Thermoactinomyces sp. DSM 45892]